MSDITDQIDENPIAGALGHTDHHKKLAKKANALGELVTDGYLAEGAIVPNTPEGRTALASSSELSAAFVAVRTSDGHTLPPSTIVVITLDKTLAEVTATPVADIADITFEEV